MMPVTRRHEEHARESARFAHRFGDEKMPVVYGIEGAAENAETHSVSAPSTVIELHARDAHGVAVVHAQFA